MKTWINPNFKPVPEPPSCACGEECVEDSNMCRYCLAIEERDNAHRCTICHQNYVDSDNGFDTCETCLKTRI